MSAKFTKGGGGGLFFSLKSKGLNSTKTGVICALCKKIIIMETPGLSSSILSQMMKEKRICLLHHFLTQFMDRRCTDSQAIFNPKFRTLQMLPRRGSLLIQ